MRSTTFLILAAASIVAADKSSELEGLLADIKANLSDYLSQISAGNSPPPAVLSLAQAAQTYTDKSYTTLFDQIDIDQVNSYITGLPWYSSRLASLVDDSGEATSAAEETTAAAESTTAAESSAAETTAAAESSAAGTTAAASGTTVAVVTENGAMAYAPMALAALIPALL